MPVCRHCGQRMAVYALACRHCGHRTVQLAVARSVSLLFFGVLAAYGLYTLQSCAFTP